MLVELLRTWFTKRLNSKTCDYLNPNIYVLRKSAKIELWFTLNVIIADSTETGSSKLWLLQCEIYLIYIVK